MSNIMDLARVPQKTLDYKWSCLKSELQETEDPGSKNGFEGGCSGACIACWFETPRLSILQSS